MTGHTDSKFNTYHKAYAKGYFSQTPYSLKTLCCMMIMCELSWVCAFLEELGHEPAKCYIQKLSTGLSDS